MKRPIPMLALAGWLAAPATAHAQAPASSVGDTALHRGTQVRVVRQMNGWRRYEAQGSLVRYVGDTAVVQVNFDSVAVIPLDADRSLELRTSRRSNVARGAAIGLVVGAAVGAMVGAAAYHKCTSTEPFGCIADFGIGASIAGGAVLIGGGGALIGALVGAANGTYTWMPVRRSSTLRAGLAPVGGGVRFTLGFGF